MAEEINAEDVAFNPEIIAAAWDEFGDGVPAVAAAAIVNEFYDCTVTANNAEESDRDVIFPEADIMVEEKAIGVCSKETAENHAGAYIPLDFSGESVLALNGAAVYENWTVPEA